MESNKVFFCWDFPGIPVVKTPCFQFRGHGFDPLGGRGGKVVFGYVNGVIFSRVYGWRLIARETNHVIRGLEFSVLSYSLTSGEGRRAGS